MKPQQYDTLQMQIEKTSNHATQMLALIRIYHYIMENEDYHYSKSDISEFRDIIFTCATRLRREAVSLKTYFEFQIEQA